MAIGTALGLVIAAVAFVFGATVLIAEALG